MTEDGNNFGLAHVSGDQGPNPVPSAPAERTESPETNGEAILQGLMAIHDNLDRERSEAQRRANEATTLLKDSSGSPELVDALNIAWPQIAQHIRVKTEPSEADLIPKLSPIRVPVGVNTVMFEKGLAIVADQTGLSFDVVGQPDEGVHTVHPTGESSAQSHAA